MTLQIHKVMMTVNIESIQKVARVEGLKRKDYQVMLFLMGHLDSLRPRKVDKKQIARELYMDKKDVEKSLENLIDANILFFGDSDHVEKGYMFNL